MAVNNLYMTATGLTGIKSMSLREGLSQAAAEAQIICTGVSAAIGDSCTVVGGYDSAYSTFINGGYVKSIVQRRPERDYTVTVRDKVSLAVDYFMASNTPDKRRRIGTGGSDTHLGRNYGPVAGNYRLHLRSSKPSPHKLTIGMVGH